MSHKQNPRGKKQEAKDNSAAGTATYAQKQSDYTGREPEAKLSETTKWLRWLPDWFLLLTAFGGNRCRDVGGNEERTDYNDTDNN